MLEDEANHQQDQSPGGGIHCLGVYPFNSRGSRTLHVPYIFTQFYWGGVAGYWVMKHQNDNTRSILNPFWQLKARGGSSMFLWSYGPWMPNRAFSELHNWFTLPYRTLPIDSESHSSMRSEKLCCLGSYFWYHPLYLCTARPSWNKKVSDGIGNNMLARPIWRWRNTPGRAEHDTIRKTYKLHHLHIPPCSKIIQNHHQHHTISHIVAPSNTSLTRGAQAPQ